ncbi:hypothetical protein FR742_12425 [Nonomuraea sp. C10]|nr:hypothetical protein FR742_12425 [Nonomuraea sp. C10]
MTGHGGSEGPPGALAAVNPRVVLAGVTPFGQTGPYARHAAGDLVVAATGGAVWLSGDPDRPPVRISSGQYFLHAAAEAVVHTLVAVRHARLTGRGQHVDVSAQLATIRSLMNAVPGPYTDGSVVDRASFGEPVPGLPYSCTPAATGTSWRPSPSGQDQRGISPGCATRGTSLPGWRLRPTAIPGSPSCWPARWRRTSAPRPRRR